MTTSFCFTSLWSITVLSTSSKTTSDALSTLEGPCAAGTVTDKLAVSWLADCPADPVRSLVCPVGQGAGTTTAAVCARSPVGPDEPPVGYPWATISVRVASLTITLFVSTLGSFSFSPSTLLASFLQIKGWCPNSLQ
ncbi:unnamed protein product [Cuscuta epithymum]|uniref:Secreted protein n=1 Tax=Cuscuta epithymum TaxID=186058 RepID=A0AAV0CAH8_9ASTE|nr:unnamed protein product [Cuscuta epithymum]